MDSPRNGDQQELLSRVAKLERKNEDLERDNSELFRKFQRSQEKVTFYERQLLRDSPSYSRSRSRSPPPSDPEDSIVTEDSAVLNHFTYSSKVGRYEGQLNRHRIPHGEGKFCAVTTGYTPGSRPRSRISVTIECSGTWSKGKLARGHMCTTGSDGSKKYGGVLNDKDDGLWTTHQANGVVEETTYRATLGWQRHGRWSLTSLNGNKYSGYYQYIPPKDEWTYSQSKKCGIWTKFFKAENCTISGEMVDTKPHGVWTLTQADGSIRSLTFDHGKIPGEHATVLAAAASGRRITRSARASEGAQLFDGRPTEDHFVHKVRSFAKRGM
eukprot:35466_1